MEEIKKYYGVVYKITNIINGKGYIGQTMQGLEKRMKGHLHDASRNSPRSLIGKAIKKYGWKIFTIEIIFYAIDKESLNVAEIELIKEYKSNNSKYGYNITEGGGGTCGHRHTDESNQKNRMAHIGKKASEVTRQKISHAGRGRLVSKETRAKLRISKKDKKRKPFSEEAKINMGLAGMGRIHSESTRQKIGYGRRGKLHSEETKLKLSLAKKGIPCSEEHKLKMARGVVQLSLKNEIINIFTSLVIAQLITGIDDSSISKVCQGKAKTAGGFQWCYVGSKDHV